MGSFTIFPKENFIDLTLVQFGWEQCDPLHSYGPVVRNNYIFHYVLSGRGIVEYNNSDGDITRFHIGASSGFLICPGQIVTYWADQTDPWKYGWIEFNGIQTQNVLRQIGLNESNPIYLPKSAEDAANVVDSLQHIIMNPDAHPMRLIGQLYLFFDVMIESSQKQRNFRNQSQNGYYIREATNFIERHYVEPISVNDIADFCGLSRNHFGRIFKNWTGKSPQKYLTDFRMKKAIELMRSTDLLLSEIAIKVGYPNALYFSKVFHRTFGVAPRTYRKNDRMVLEDLEDPKKTNKED